ncbi:MAG TPA: MerR family transcriptional regulator [Pilimelia sp.]|nr:MerR family transcriptional regulator [Pilimelia sp.]
MTDEPLSAGAVARRLGIAVTTLRTWHQRYGLGPSQHLPGHHRRYTSGDLARLEVMRRLTASGVPAAEAARWATRDLPGSGDRADAAVRAGAGVWVEDGARAGGGRTIGVGRAGRTARGLARASMRLDAPAMREIVAGTVAELGVVDAWDTVLCPVLIGIGHRHAATNALVEVEHLISRTVSEVLGAIPRPPSGGRPPRVLLACADEEQHSLALEALAAALAEAGVDCRMLGARVPPAALREAVARTGPVVVVLWAQVPATADVAQLTPLLTGPGRPMIVAAAGPGWERGALPSGVATPDCLADALAVTAAAIGSPGRT